MSRELGADSTGGTCRVRLLFADDGAFHHEVVSVPAEALERHERLIDCLLEDPVVLRTVFVDAQRLCSATMEPDSPT